MTMEQIVGLMLIVSTIGVVVAIIIGPDKKKKSEKH